MQVFLRYGDGTYSYCWAVKCYLIMLSQVFDSIHCAANRLFLVTDL